MIILAMDGLELSFVEKFNCRSLKQKIFGKTDISEFSLPKTVILWASFLTGRNMEPEVCGDLWSFKVSLKGTFLKFFKNFKVLDLPAFSYSGQHRREKQLLRRFFEKDNNHQTVRKYHKTCWKIHQKVKEKFLREIKKNYPLLISYFALPDVIGHLNFGDFDKMREVYSELDQVAKKTNEAFPHEPTIIISDHGMKPVGRFGDHTMNGFYSLNFPADLPETPKITDFFALIKSNASGHIFSTFKKKESA